MSSHNNYYNQYSPVETSNDADKFISTADPQIYSHNNNYDQSRALNSTKIDSTSKNSNHTDPGPGPQIIMPDDNYSVTENKIKRKPGRPKGSLNKNGYKKKHERFLNAKSNQTNYDQNYQRVDHSQYQNQNQDHHRRNQQPNVIKIRNPARIVNPQGEPVYDDFDQNSFDYDRNNNYNYNNRYSPVENQNFHQTHNASNTYEPSSSSFYQNNINHNHTNQNVYNNNNDNSNINYLEQDLTFTEEDTSTVDTTTGQSQNSLDDLDPISAAIQKTVQNTENGNLGVSSGFATPQNQNQNQNSNLMNGNGHVNGNGNYSNYVSDYGDDDTSYYNDNESQDETIDEENGTDKQLRQEKEPKILNPDALSHNQDLDRDLEKVDCPICNKIYSTKGNLKTHMRVVHQYTPEMIEKILPNNSTKPLGHVPEHMKMVCPLCNQYYRSRANLRVHLKGTHNLSIEEARKYLPSNSNRSYSKNGADKIICVLCDKTYLGAANLKSHLRNTHKIMDNEVIKERVAESKTIKDDEKNSFSSAGMTKTINNYGPISNNTSYMSPNHSFGQSLSNLARKRKYQESNDGYYSANNSTSDQSHQTYNDTSNAINNNPNNNSHNNDHYNNDFDTNSFSSKRLRNVNSHTELPVELGGLATNSGNPNGNISSLTPSETNNNYSFYNNNSNDCYNNYNNKYDNSGYSGYYNNQESNHYNQNKGYHHQHYGNNNENQNYEAYQTYNPSNNYQENNGYNNYCYNDDINHQTNRPQNSYYQTNVNSYNNGSRPSSSNGVIIPNASTSHMMKMEKKEDINCKENVVKTENCENSSKETEGSFTKSMYGNSEEIKQKCLELHNSSVSQWNKTIVQNTC